MLDKLWHCASLIYSTLRAEANIANIPSQVTRPIRDVERIAYALTTAREQILAFDFGALETKIADNGDPVTALDHRINNVLRDLLPSPEEGWLSEESKDDPGRLKTGSSPRTTE